MAGAASGLRPNSALRKPTTASISRLSQPRDRQRSNVAPATPKRDFGSALRGYPRDNKPAAICTIPDTPHLHVARRAQSTTRVSASATAVAPPPPGPASAPRAPVNVSRLINRLSQPRTVPVAAAPAAGGAAAAAGGGRAGGLPAPQQRRLPAVPLGRTHGLPVVRRTTTNTTVTSSAAGSAHRSRSNSAARAAAGGLVEGAGSMRAASAAASNEQQQQQ